MFRTLRLVIGFKSGIRRGILLRVGALAAAVAPFVVGSLAISQSRGQDRIRFEVASIKPSEPSPILEIFPPYLKNGRLSARNVSLREVLGDAYGLTEGRVIGPDWLSNERFDFQAKAPDGVPDSQMNLMLQALLIDRFGLVAHLESRNRPVYYLVVAKGGIKMSVYPAPARAEANPNPLPSPMMRGTLTMLQLAHTLSNVVDRPVLDKTELNGRYNIVLRYSRFSQQSSAEGAGIGPPDVFTALPEQLGLRLQAAKADVRVVIIDHIERAPSDN